jgi:hypothetical protein
MEATPLMKSPAIIPFIQMPPVFQKRLGLVVLVGFVAGVLCGAPQGTTPPASSPIEEIVSAPRSGSVSPPSGQTIDPKSLELIEKKRTGTAVLDSEIPRVKQLMDRAVAVGVDYAMKTRGKEYESLFRSYGFDEETVQRMLEHIRAVYEAKSLLQTQSSQLSHARRDFEDEMKKLLGDRMPEYQKYEAEESARRQVDSFELFAHSQGKPITQEDQDVIQNIVGNVGLYTEESTSGVGGVFQDWPSSGYGDRLKKRWAANADLLEEKLEALRKEVVKSKLKPETAKLLEDYYAAALKEYTALAQGISKASVGAKESGKVGTH